MSADPPLPADWRFVPIGEIFATSQYGLSLSSDPDGSTPIIGMKDMSGGKVLGDDWARVSVNDTDRARFRLRRGDILLNRTNSTDLVGKVSLWDRAEEAVFASYLVRFVVDSRQAVPEYVNHYLNADDGQQRLRRLSTRGVSQANINPTVFQQKFLIAMPPLAEQRRIAAVLDAWDEAIDRTERLVAAKRRHRDALAPRLIRGGREVAITDVADVSFSGVDKKVDNAERAVRLCNYMDVLGTRRLTNDLKYSAGSASIQEVQRFGLREGDVIFTKDSETAEDIAEVSVVAEPLDNVVCGYHLAVARPRSGVANGHYLAHAIRIPRVRAQFVQRVNGVVRFGLTLPAISEIKVPMPSFVEQIRIAGVLDSADDAINVLTRTMASLRLQKRGLMQKLLTGAWRVPESIDALLPGGSRAAEVVEAAE